MAKHSVGVVLFTRDLRLRDHPALTAAIAQCEQVVPLFAFDDAIIARREVGPNRWQFLLDSLHSLDASLRDRGSVLVVRCGGWVDEVLSLPRAHLLVDGYNVTKTGYGTLPLADQRGRLLTALEGLASRTKAEITCVFDGADVGGVLPPRRPGVRVVFSPEGEEADAVVVRQAADLPVEVPVVVASSDGWVEEHARESGAHVVSSETLLRALRR